MIIYGSRMYGKKNRIRSHGRCAHCGKVGGQTSYDGRKWGHLYFIPLFPVAGKVRVLRECNACRTGSHIPLETLPGLVETLQKTLDEAVVALGAQETEMTLHGRAQPVVSVISSHVSDVYCLIGEREVAQFLENLKSVNAEEALLLAEAKLAEIKGDFTGAETKFAELSGRSSHPTVLYQAAQFFYDRGRIPEAVKQAERVETMLVADLDVKQLLIDCYTAGKEWTKVAITYESCFLLAPALKQQKPILKAYKTACKKAGREPRKD